MSDTPKLLALMAVSRNLPALDYSKQLEVLVRELERENAALRNEVVRLNNQTMWVCSCGGTDCAGQRENTALRAALEKIVSGGYAEGADEAHPAIWVARVALRKEAQP